MKKLLCLILIHYIFSIFDVYADTIAVFPIKCKKDSINVTVFQPTENDRKIMVIIATNMLFDISEYMHKYSLVDSLLKNGISCCFFDKKEQCKNVKNKYPLFTQTKNIVLVFNKLKSDKRYCDYKLGLLGINEAGLPVAKAANKLNENTFAILYKTNVLPESVIHQNILMQKNVVLPLIFNSYGMKPYEFSRVVQNVFHEIDDKHYYNRKMLNKEMLDVARLNKNINDTCFVLLHSFFETYMERRSRNSLFYNNLEKSIQKIKCPLLYITSNCDLDISGFLNLLEFEEIMYKKRKTNFSTIVLKTSEPDNEAKEQNQWLNLVIKWLFSIY